MDRLEAKLFQQAPSKQPNNKPPSQNDKNQNSKKSINNPAPVPTAKLDTNLTSQLMKELALILGPEAKNCYFNLKEISQLRNAQVLQTFRDVYSKFETIPVLFLSFVQNHKEQIVYLWQINRKCPYQKGTEFMVLDSKSQKLDVMPHPSLLVLAKIKPFKGEEIIDAKLIGDYQLMVKSRGSSEGPYYIFRLYNVKDFYGTSKVNPYREEILAGDVYSYEFQVKRLPSENPLLEVSLYKRLNIEELGMMKQQQQQIPPSDPQATPSNSDLLNTTQSIDRNTLILQQSCEYSSQQWPRDNLFSEMITIDDHQMFYLIDKETCSIIRFHENTFALATFPEAKNVSKIHRSGQSLTLISNDNVYEVSDDLQLISTGAEIITHPILLENIASQPQKFYDFFTYNGESHAIMLNNTIFRSISIEKSNDRPVDLFNIRDALKTSKSLSWTSYMMGISSPSPLLFYVCNNFLHVRDIHQALELSSINTREKIIALPSEMTSEWANNKAGGAQKDHKGVKEQRQSWDWEIIGFSSRKLYLSRKFVNQQSVQLVEMNILVGVEGLFSEDFLPEFKFIRKEDYYLMPFDLEMFAQFDIRQEIVFISFENEPFYHDEVNLMYNVQLSLKNPQEEDNQKDMKKAEGSTKKEDKENKEKNFYKKMEKAKVEISHKKDINKGLEETKEALKNIRGDISSKMGEVQEFNKKYLDQEKNAKKNQDKEKVKLTDPGKVNKDGVQLYQEIKTEKKKINKQRDKEKTMRKKGDARQDY